MAKRIKENETKMSTQLQKVRDIAENDKQEILDKIFAMKQDVQGCLVVHETTNNLEKE